MTSLAALAAEEQEERMSETKATPCAACGMLTMPREYHPFAACDWYRRASNRAHVIANIRAVVEYGMRAQSSGVTLDQAMSDHTIVLGQAVTP